MSESPADLARLRLRAWDTGDGRAAITYEVETPAGTVEACDWVFVKDGLIREVNSYYDSVKNRAALER